MENAYRAFDLLKSADIDALRRLVDEDSSLAEARDASGVSLLMQCLYRGHVDLAALIANKKKSLDIFEAAALGHLNRLKACLGRDEHGRSDLIDAHSPDGFTALHFACYFGQPAAAQLLVENCAPVDAVTTNAMRLMPLHSAASARNLEACRLLLEHGAPVNAQQRGGWAAIHAAAQNGDLPMVELLLKYQADPKLLNDERKTPAMVAREKGHEQVAVLLDGAH